MSSSVSNTSLPYTVIIMVNKKAYMFLLNMLPSVVGLFFLLQCWAGLPPTVLGLSVLSKGVTTGLICNSLWFSLCTNYAPFASL